jgi:hypothetical protein
MKPTIKSQYTSNGTKLIVFEINGEVKTMPLKFFSKKYKIPTTTNYTIGNL